MVIQKIKNRLWEIVSVARTDDTTSKVFDSFILTLIFLNIVAVIIGTIASIERQFSYLLYLFEVFSVIIFTIEYAARIWSCTTATRYAQSFKGRLRFMITPLAIIDFVAILPFYLPFIYFDLRIIRALRLLRIARILKLERYSSAMRTIKKVFKTKRAELLIMSGVFLILLMIAASCMYYAEHYAQPKAFADMLSAMWWAVTTLTTVGYGDTIPITGPGKIIASMISIIGIGFVALLTGILTLGFVEEMKNKKKSSMCPHCGKELS